jgi:DNA-directed RNA polymerase subunit RPC12/RpoP
MPRHSESSRPRTKGISLGELYSASRLLSDQIIANAEDESELHDALARCPQCGSRHFTEFRDQR